ncbi:uncharacterized protein METZ01_LOCUS464948, partial [marine metagenome]
MEKNMSKTPDTKGHLCKIANTPGRTSPQFVNGRMHTLRRKIFFKPDILF